MCMCAGTHLCEDIRGQFVEVGSLLPPCGFQGSHSGHGTWHQAPQSYHGWPAERYTFLGKKMFFKRENILIKVVSLGRWSNVFPKNGFAIGWVHGGRCCRALHTSRGCNDRARAIINNTLPALLCKSRLC